MNSTPPSEILREAAARLKLAETVLREQIRDYPRPISGCDAQFNHLLAERQRAGRALAALNEEIHIPTPRAP